MQESKLSNFIFLHRVFKGLGDAVLKVFIPLIIYKQTNNLMLCFMWAGLNQVFSALSNIFLKKFIKKLPIISIISHIFLLIAAQFLLIGELSIISIIILAVLDGIASTLYHSAINLIFGFIEKNPNTAKFETGYKVGQIVFSIISAFVLGNLLNSILFVFIFATVLYLASVVPLIVNYKQLHFAIDLSTQSSFKDMLKKSKWFYLYEISVNVIFSFMSVVLPLYLYISGLSFTLAGTVIGLQDLLKIIGSYLGMLFVKLKKQKLMIILCAALLIVSITLILLIPNKYLIYALSLVAAFAYQGQFVIMFGFFIKYEKEQKQFQDSIFLRDAVGQFTRVATYSNYLIFQLFPVLFALGIAFSAALPICSVKCYKNYQIDNQKQSA